MHDITLLSTRCVKNNFRCPCVLRVSLSVDMASVSHYDRGCHSSVRSRLPQRLLHVREETRTILLVVARRFVQH